MFDRPYARATDTDRVFDLLRAWRLTTRPDRHPTLYRLRMLLLSRLQVPERDARLWAAGDGGLVGCALLLQGRIDSPRFELAAIVHPHAPRPLFADEMLPWALARGREIARDRAAPITIEYEVDDHDAGMEALLARHGFVPLPIQALYMARSLDTSLPAPALPLGFTVRALAGRDEIGDYLALYNEVSTPLSRTQRLALMDTPDYSPALDLVAVDSAGAIAAFCECSIGRHEWERGGARVGWIDHLGTHPARRGQGLGQALTLAGLHRLRAAGAGTAVLVTHSANMPAQRLYARLAFEVIGAGLWFAKDIAPTPMHDADPD